MDQDSPRSSDDDQDLVHSSHLDETLRELQDKVNEHEETLRKVRTHAPSPSLSLLTPPTPRPLDLADEPLC